MRAPTYDRWFAGKVDIFPPAVRGAVVEQFNDLWGAPTTESKSPSYVQNMWLCEASQGMRNAQVQRAFDESAIRTFAENYSRLAARIPALADRADFARSIGVAAPSGAGVTENGALLRLADPLWWRRQLRKVWTRAAENGLRDVGAIRKGRAPYASDEAVRLYRNRQHRAREFLERSRLVNLDTGEQMELLKVAEKSLANKSIRRTELMVRSRGFKEIAAELGHQCDMWTLTAPSYFHAQLSEGGRNPAYQRAVVREAQQWLCKMWARVRAFLARKSVLIYGFRIAEAHHDGTPHWHLQAFGSMHALDCLRASLPGIWLSEYGHEPGSAAVRTQVLRIDPAKGDATGYIAKYISKNIDGHGSIGTSNDLEAGGTVDANIVRVTAWASIHGIRQFQQIGGPPVGLWREARRLRDPEADVAIERARLAADKNDWCGFVAAVGGINAGRRTNLKIEKIEDGTRNRYGEHRPARVIGLRYASATVITRPDRWRIERITKGGGLSCEGARRALLRKPAASGLPPPIFSALGPVAITVRGAPSAGEPSAWTNSRETSQAGPN